MLTSVRGVAAEDVLAEEALAKSPVQMIASQANNYEMTANVAVNGFRAPQMDALANYARGADGQWQIPRQVDRENPWVRVLVLAPGKPTLVEVAIQLDGKPFAAAREELIDKLMDHATVESLVRDAVKVPIPNETRKESESEAKSSAESESAEESEAESTESETDSDESVAKENSDDTASESAEGDVTAKKEDKIKKTEKPMVEVQRRQARTVAQRLVNYMASAEVKADREEIRWLLAEWTGGPAMLSLGPAMSWQRVGLAPLWNALDVDGDDSLSAAEVAAASERLGQADVDENSIIELEELSAIKPHSTASPRGYPLVVIIDHETDWQRLASHLQAAYGRRASNQQASASATTPTLLTRLASGEATLTASDLETLLNEPPSFRLAVRMGNTPDDDKTLNELALISATSEDYVGTEKMISVVSGAEYMEFSAGEPQEPEASEPVATQVSIGAVVEGYPLFRLVDRNGDRRLSPRECRNLKNVLAGIDLDGDGQISRREKPTAIRIAIARGPHAHEMLAEPTSALREFTGASQDTSPAPAAPAAKVPRWFTDMDRNRDGDLSRSEFLGTSEQFKQLDRDGDGLIGSLEATD